MKKLAFIAALALAAPAVHAATITSLVGDKDGFGGQITPETAGANTGPSFDNRTASDPLFTDVYLFEQNVGPGASPVTYTHSYMIPISQTPVSARLTIFESGMADDRGPWDVDFNGTVVGQIIGPDASSTLSKFHTFSIDVTLLTGADLVSLIYLDTVGEGYAIDYSELAIETGTIEVIPLPATLPMLLSALAGVACVARRKRDA
jgi:hypothetical protein